MLLVDIYSYSITLSKTDLIIGVLRYDAGDRNIILWQASHVQWTALVVSSSQRVLVWF